MRRLRQQIVATQLVRPLSSLARGEGVTQMEAKGEGVHPNRYYSLEECMRMPGVRYTAVPECPAPISEPLKQMLWVKRIPAARVPHPADPAIGLTFLSDAEGNVLLQQATAQTSWPVLFCDDERPRTSWIEQLEFAENHGAPDSPKLIPANPTEHATMIGYIHLIMGERGFFWMRRLIHVMQPDRPSAFAEKYSYDGDKDVAEQTVLKLLKFFDHVLQCQRTKGSKYLVGDALSAADLYWALGSMICIHPPQALVASDEINSYFGGNVANGKGRTAAEFLGVFRPTNGPFDPAITPLLREHQEYIIATYCNYPLK
eukprot:COSAG02_NODE_6307_length_3665_cov_3.765564_3_plen_315_part_00